MLMILPSTGDWRRNCCVWAWAHRKTPVKLTAITRSQAAWSISSSAPRMPMPALFTAMSSRPNWPATRWTMAWTWSFCVTSQGTNNESRPKERISSAVFSPADSFRSTIATSAPARASATAQPRPMPTAAPVTRAFLPVRSNRERSGMADLPYSLALGLENRRPSMSWKVPYSVTNAPSGPATIKCQAVRRFKSPSSSMPSGLQ